VVYSTYHGGSDSDSGESVAVDSSGNAYVAGGTSSTDFPTANAFQPRNGGASDAFITKFNASGGALIFSTYLGGSSSDRATGIALDSDNAVYVAGIAASANFPTVQPLQATPNTNGGFVTKFNAAADGLIYSTSIGPPLVAGIAVDRQGNVYTTGSVVDRLKLNTGCCLTDAFVIVISELFARTYFPQVAVGGGFSTTLTLTNTGATEASGKLIFTDQQGNPMIVQGSLSNASTASTGSSFPIMIPAGGTTWLAVTALDPAAVSTLGWAQLDASGGSVSGVATFQRLSDGTLKAVAGVFATEPLYYATIPVDNDDKESRFTGYAIANPNTYEIRIKLGSVNETGQFLADDRVIRLAPRQQLARFLHEDFPARVNFKGSMVLRSQALGAFVVVALVENRGQFTVVPVIRGKSTEIPN
jgi:hypothetical protein